MLLVLLLAVFCMFMALVQYTDKNKKVKNKIYSCIPWDAVDRLNAFLNVDKSINKEYKLAVLIVEDEYGNKHIEDIDLRGNSSEPVSLSSFAVKTKDICNSFLFDFVIVNTIAKKVNCIFGETERYYAFQLTKENVLAGRHGKQKRNVINDYVMMLDLSRTELFKIANLSF